MDKITLKIRRTKCCVTLAALCSVQQQILHCNRAQCLIRISEVKKGSKYSDDVVQHVEQRWICFNYVSICLCISTSMTAHEILQCYVLMVLFLQTNKWRVHACVISNTLLALIHSGLAPDFSMSDTLTNTQTDKHSH